MARDTMSEMATADDMKTAKDIMSSMMTKKPSRDGISLTGPIKPMHSQS
jgi:hypothetical protein